MPEERFPKSHPCTVAVCPLFSPIRRIDVVDWDSAAVAKHLTPHGFGLPHLKIFDGNGKLLLERSTDAGQLDALIADVRALVAGEAAKHSTAPYAIVVTEKGFEPNDVVVPVGKPVTLRFERRAADSCATEVILTVDGKRKHQVTDPVKRLITYNELNLMAAWPFKGKFDVIFCRNVVIYFDEPTQMRIWSRFSELLPTGGTLYIGHSERVSGDAKAAFDNTGITTYRYNGKPGGRV